jgi:hypothetical protein
MKKVAAFRLKGFRPKNCSPTIHSHSTVNSLDFKSSGKILIKFFNNSTGKKDKQDELARTALAEN